MEYLPNEMLVKIFAYCSTKDLVNLSCCSRQCCTFTKPTIWSKIRICGCQHIPEHVFENLPFSNHLVLGVTNQCKRCNRAKNDANAMREDDFISGYQFTRILTACNPDKVNTLTICSAYTEGLHRALNILNCVQNLTIAGYVRCDWECIIGMQNLTSFSVAIKNNNISPEKAGKLGKIRGIAEDNTLLQIDGFRQLLVLNRLKSLEVNPIDEKILGWITKSNRLTELTLMDTLDVSLEPITALKNLRSIKLQTTTNVPVSIKPLAELKNLRRMSVYGYSYEGGAMQHLCLELKALHTMNLYTIVSPHYFHSMSYSWYKRGYFLFNGDFSMICGMPSLTTLHLSNCETLTGACFVHISKSKSLREFTFSVHDRSHHAAFSATQCCSLNAMQSLQRFTLYGKREKILPIVNAMCKEKEWSVHAIEQGFAKGFTLLNQY